ncbi:D-inositol-3-phosphate glycosyltransferase [compost metagenome]
MSDAGGLPENVRDGQDGWVVPAGGVDELAQMLRNILSNEENLPAMGASARRRVEQAFSSSGFIADTKKVYKQARVVARQVAASI